MSNGLTSDAGDEDLFGKVDLNVSDFNALRDSEVGSFCKAIHALGVAHLGDLADDGWTQAKLDEVDAKIGLYTGVVGKPRHMKTVVTSLVRQLDGTFKGIDTILDDKIDRRMEKFKETAPEFYNAYFAARKIVDNRTGPHKNGENGNGTEQPPVPPA